MDDPDSRDEGLMKTFLLFLLITLLPIPAIAETYVQWDHPYPDLVDGYTLYYSDGVEQYNVTVLGGVTEIPMSTLNLTPGVDYTFHVTAFNSAGESAPSNGAEWTNVAHTPPQDKKPGIVINIPGPITITIGQ